MADQTRPKYAAKRPTVTSTEVEQYTARYSSAPDSHLAALDATTRAQTGAASAMQIASDQAAFLEILVRASGTRTAVEVGTFTGYSALAIARGLGEGGRLLTCDVSEEWASIARAAWEAAGVGDRIELRIGPAIETLRGLSPDEQFDFAFIDADKPGYASYYSEILPRLRPGGLLLIDDVLQGGAVVDPSADDERVVAIRSINEMVAADPRVMVAMTPIGNGVSVVQKLQ
jgi:caffeoyl-CoA O-methyltransferase